MAQKKAVVRKEKATENQEKTPKATLLKAVENSSNPLDNFPKAKTIGEALKAARRSRDETIKSVAAKLRISEPYLKAIETMDFNNLPEQVYALGFVRSYAHHLGLDPQETVNQFRQDIFESAPSDKKLSIPQHLETTTLPTKRILWISAVAVLIFLGVARYFWNINHVDSSLEQELSNLLRPSVE
ncbi:MAG TPA: hypothetical protein DD412_01840 [Holosporales bacterium]|nr:hypothetical protein [Holosporales bacterium]